MPSSTMTSLNQRTVELISGSGRRVPQLPVSVILSTVFIAVFRLSSSISRASIVVADRHQDIARYRRVRAMPITGTGSHFENVLRLSVQEELRSGAFVGDVVIEYQLESRFKPEVIKSLRFRFLSSPTSGQLPATEKSGGNEDASSGGRDRWFVLEETKGVIRTKSTIDRDQLCPRSAEC